MTDRQSEQSLPKVEDIDLAYILPEDIIDESHKERYERFAQENPELLQEIGRRAYVEAYRIINSDQSSLFNALDIRKIVIDNVTFALAALDAAMKRASAIDDDDGEGLPHSDVPGGDQPAV